MVIGAVVMDGRRRGWGACMSAAVPDTERNASWAQDLLVRF